MHLFRPSSFVPLKKCDFVVWTPMWLHITEIERDVQFIPF